LRTIPTIMKTFVMEIKTVLAAHAGGNSIFKTFVVATCGDK